MYPDCIPTPTPTPPTPKPTPLCDPPYEDMVYPDCIKPIPSPPLPPKCEAPYEDRIYPDCTPTPPPPPTPCTEEMPITSCGTTAPPVPIIIPPASCDEFTTKNAENVQ